MINWDYMITYGGPELFVTFVVIFLTPLLYWLILRRFNWIVKIIGILSIWVGAIYIAYWDVYQIAKEAERLCREEAGLHVYKTVEAEGFIGATNIERWSEYGFTYLESFYKQNKTRISLKDGEIVYEVIPDYISRYEYIGDSEKLKLPFVRDRKIVRDRKTGEIVGEIVSFAVYPGWLDSHFLGMLGFSWSPPRCDDNYLPESQKAMYSYSDLIKAVIKPTNFN